MPSVTPAKQMTFLERMLLRLEESPWQALFRIFIGFLLAAAFFRVRGEAAPAWQFVIFVLIVLVLLRLAPAFVRHIFPFSKEVQTIWARQRTLAKRYDSYQWRKLFWIGCGLAAYSAASGRLVTVQAVVISICLVGGGLGLFFWRRVRALAPTPGMAASKAMVAPPSPSAKPDVIT